MSIQELDSETISRVMGQFRPGTGSDRYIRFVDQILGYQLGIIQYRLLTALEKNRRTVAVGANGVGKSYGVGGLGSIAALYCNLDATVNITSGSYGQLDDTIWKPIKSIHRNSPLPGKTLDNKRELKSGLDEEWYLKCLSPKYPADLEGRHNRRMIYIIEEADKPGITEEHIDSAESTMTDEDDRMIVLANPPEEEINVVSKLMNSEKWETLNFSSFESYNVQIDIGKESGEKIPGLVELSEIKENWEDWIGMEWPGWEDAFTAHEDHENLDTRWYRRRVGEVPPDSAERWKPVSIGDVRRAYRRDPMDIETRRTPTTVGIDVARSGDRTVMIGVHGRELVVHYSEQGDDHEVQKRELKRLIEGFSSKPPRIVVDAVGEGSGLADYLALEFPRVTRFSNGMMPVDEDEYYNCWAEGLDLLGEYVEEGYLSDTDLREEIVVTAGTVTFSERSLKSRGGSDGTGVVEASKKEEIKEELGHSPDLLDGALMAVWGENASKSSNQKLTW